MSDSMIETIRLNDDRFLGVAWKEGRVHSLCVATNESAAQRVIEQSLRQKPITAEVFRNIEKMVKLLPF